MSAVDSLKAFVLCAGQALRFYPHTQTASKALIPFLNVPLVFYNLQLLKSLGVGRWLVNARTEQEDLQQKLPGLAVTAEMSAPAFSIEKTLLGSAGGLYQARNFFEKEKHFYYLNGDSFIWPEKEDVLLNFYSAHIESRALASFLSTPSSKTAGVLWADDQNKIHSFLQKPKHTPVKAYDFCGLALMSHSILNELSLGKKHIFKDVMENLCLKKKLRVHNCFHLKTLNMNQLSSYLDGVLTALSRLINSGAPDKYLTKILDAFSPGWSEFSGSSYVSAVDLPLKLKEHLSFRDWKSKDKNYLFCGPGVKGLKNLSVKNFAVLGAGSFIQKPALIDSSVLAEKVCLHKHLSRQLLLS